MVHIRLVNSCLCPNQLVSRKLTQTKLCLKSWKFLLVFFKHVAWRRPTFLHKPGNSSSGVDLVIDATRHVAYGVVERTRGARGVLFAEMQESQDVLNNVVPWQAWQAWLLLPAWLFTSSWVLCCWWFAVVGCCCCRCCCRRCCRRCCCCCCRRRRRRLSIFWPCAGVALRFLDLFYYVNTCKYKGHVRNIVKPSLQSELRRNLIKAQKTTYPSEQRTFASAFSVQGYCAGGARETDSRPWGTTETDPKTLSHQRIDSDVPCCGNEELPQEVIVIPSSDLESYIRNI